MKASVCLILCAVMTLSLSTAFGNDSRSSSQCAKQINQAVEIAQSDPVQSEALFKKAFQTALTMTQSSKPAAVREQGFALACRCLHPSLNTETSLAIETYLKLFPKGRHLKDVLFSKLILDFSLQRTDEIEKTLEQLAASVRGNDAARFHTLGHNALFSINHYVTAQNFLSESLKKRPSKVARADSRKFKRFDSALKQLLARIDRGDIAVADSIKALEQILPAVYFAPDAPAAEMKLVELRDSLNPSFHTREFCWRGKSRIVYHHVPPQMRLADYRRVVKDWPQAPEELRVSALKAAYGIAKHEMFHEHCAEAFLNEMSELPSGIRQAKIERLLATLTEEESIATAEGNAALSQLLEMESVFPYDNGFLPEITLEDILELKALSDLILGDRTELAALLRKYNFKSQYKFRSIPLDLLYLIALDMKTVAAERLDAIRDTMPLVDVRMIEELLFPLYKQPTIGERTFLAVCAACEQAPKLAIDLLLKGLENRMFRHRTEHAFAMLANLYQKYRSYQEAQYVWNLLRISYPESTWLR